MNYVAKPGAGRRAELEVQAANRKVGEILSQPDSLAKTAALHQHNEEMKQRMKAVNKASLSNSNGMKFTTNVARSASRLARVGVEKTKINSGAAFDSVMGAANVAGKSVKNTVKNAGKMLAGATAAAVVGAGYAFLYKPGKALVKVGQKTVTAALNRMGRKPGL